MEVALSTTHLPTDKELRALHRVSCDGLLQWPQHPGHTSCSELAVPILFGRRARHYCKIRLVDLSHNASETSVRPFGSQGQGQSFSPSAARPGLSSCQ